MNGYDDFTVDHLSPLRRLWIAFWAEGELAEREGRMADAAGSYMDMVRMGYGISRGRLMVDSLVGDSFFMKSLLYDEIPMDR